MMCYRPLISFGALVFLLLIGYGVCDFHAAIEIAKQFYEKKHVSLVTAFVCWGIGENKLLRGLSAAGIQTNFVKSEDALVNLLQNDEYFRVGIFVDVSCDGAKAVLHKASKEKLFTLQKYWLLLQSTTLNNTNNTSANRFDAAYFTDNNINFVDQDEAHSCHYLSTTGHEVLGDLRILINSEVTWLQPNWEAEIEDSKEEYLLLDVYRINKTSNLNISLAGYADISGNGNVKLYLLHRENTMNRRNNLHATHYKTAIVLLFPDSWTGWYDLRYRHIDKWTKIHWPIFGFLAKQMNFTFEVTYQQDNYGWLINGSFNGMMGHMEREEVEFPSTGIFIRPDRFAVAEYCADTFPLRTNLYHSRVVLRTEECIVVVQSRRGWQGYIISASVFGMATVMFRQPSLSSVSNIFILPFNRRVWWSCAVLYLVALGVLALQIFLTVHRNLENEMNNATWEDVCTLVLAAICQQGFHTSPSTLAGRISVFVLMLSSLFLFTSYSANIVALLQTPSSSIRTISDLTHSPMVVGVENMTYNYVYMTETTDPELTQFYKHKIEPQGEKAYCHADVGMKQILQFMRAFQVDTTAAYKIMSETFTEYEKCGLMEIDLFPAPVFSIAVTRGSALKEPFGQRVRWYREVGLLDRLWKIWMPQKAKCEGKGSGFVSVSLTEFSPALFVVQYGIVAALVILLLEIIYFHRIEILSTLHLHHWKSRETREKPTKHKQKPTVQAWLH